MFELSFPQRVLLLRLKLFSPRVSTAYPSRSLCAFTQRASNLESIFARAAAGTHPPTLSRWRFQVQKLEE